MEVPGRCGWMGGLVWVVRAQHWAFLEDPGATPGCGLHAPVAGANRREVPFSPLFPQSKVTALLPRRVSLVLFPAELPTTPEDYPLAASTEDARLFGGKAYNSSDAGEGQWRCGRAWLKCCWPGSGAGIGWEGSACGCCMDALLRVGGAFVKLLGAQG